MKKILNILILSLFAIGCEIDTASPETIYLPNVIKGNAYYVDNLKGSDPIPAKRVNVYLSANPQNDPYLLETKTDSLGNYKFEYIPKVDSFWLFGSSVKDGIIYSDSILYRNTGKEINKISSKDSTVYTSTDTLKLQPKYLGATLKLLITQKETILNDAKVFLFVNKDLADKTNITGTGNIKYETSDKRGIAFFHGLNEGRYFARIVSNESLVDSVYQLNPVLDSTINKTLKIEQKGKIKIRVKRNNQPVNSANVYLFVNKEFAESLFSDSIQNAVESKITNNNGELLIENLDSGTYYIGAKKGGLTSNSDIIFSIKKDDTLSKEVDLIEPGKIRTQVFQKGKVVASAEVFLFDDPLALASVTRLAPYDFKSKSMSDANGRATFKTLKEGSYFIGAKLNNSFAIVEEPINVENEKASSVTLNLIEAIPDRSLRLYVKDSLGSLLYGVNTYLFTSKLQAETVKTDTPAGYVLNDKTSSEGYVEFTDLHDNVKYFPAIKFNVVEADSTGSFTTKSKYYIGEKEYLFSGKENKVDTLTIK